METTDKNQQRNYVPGDIVGLAADDTYHGLVLREVNSEYEVIILNCIDKPYRGTCQAGQIYKVPKRQIITPIQHIPITVTSEGDLDRLDYDEDQLKGFGYDLPQSEVEPN